MDRRRFLATAGAAASLGSTAGCSGLRGSGSSGGTASPNEDEGTPTIPSPLEGQYNGFQGGSRHRGSVEGTVTGDLEAAWAYSVATDSSDHRVGTPALVDGTVYVPEGIVSEGTLMGYLTALDAGSGSVEWQSEMPGQHFVGTAVFADGVVLSRFGRTLVAVDAAAGEELWRQDMTMATPAVKDGTVFVPTVTSDGRVLAALDLRAGETLWTRSTTRPGKPPAVADDLVYYVDERIYGVDPDDGSVQWTGDTDHAANTAPTVAEETIFVGTIRNGMAAIDRANGEQRWWNTVPTLGSSSGPVTPTSPAVDDGSLFTTSLFSVASLDAASGNVRWSKEIDANGAPVVTDDAVYVGDLSGLNTVERQKPSPYPEFEQRSETGAAPAIVDGAIFYPADGLYALVG